MYLEHCQTFEERALYENSKQLKTVNYFCRKAPSKIFHTALNTLLNLLFKIMEIQKLWQILTDLNSVFNEAIMIHFADDTHLSFASKKLSTIESVMNCELKKLAE